VELTPLIDVVFLLLIFFMLSTTFISRTGLQIRMPEAESGRSHDTPDRIEVRVPEGGDLLVDGEKVDSEAALRRILADYAAGHEDPLLVIRGDRMARHGAVTTVMDAGKAAGIGRIAVGVRDPEGGGDG
jgi:biopolymer transport protein ExbD